MEDLTVEEICRRINIQTNLKDLQSKNKKKINSALTTLATITKLTKRRDALYAFVIKADEKDRNEIILLIENSVWGEKLKRKFLYHLDI